MVRKPISRIRPADQQWTPADIGSLAPLKPSIFDRRTGSGAFMVAMPPMTADEERLQASYLADRTFPPARRDWGAWIVVAALAGLFLIVTSKHWL